MRHHTGAGQRRSLSSRRGPWARAAGVLALAGLLAPCAQASAAAPTARANPHGRFLGVVGHHAGTGASPSATTATGNLAYNGGPVMHSDANYAIFWEPAGRTTTATYKTVIGNYLASVAADSGKTTNVYATDTEYYDTTGATHNPAAYNATYGGTIVDTQPYPASGCPAQNGAPCLTDAQITTEVNRLLAARNLPRGLGTIYYVFFPPSVSSCFDTTSSSCSFTYFCAYHSSFGSGSATTLYADMPYAAVNGCDPGQRPNGDPADATLNVLSHENNETITDPLGNAWYDAQGNENGDKCNFNFGSPLGGASGASYNQSISSHVYWLQQEWSNAAGGCLQRPAPTPPPGNDFSLAASPASVSAVAAGASTTTTISTAVTSGSAQAVSLSETGLPAGATASATPASVTVGGSATLTLSASASTPAGTYPITVTGTAASGSHATTVSLTVTTPAVGPGLLNGGFETGTFSGWTTLGATHAISTAAHTGAYAAMLGAATPTSGDNTVTQTITVPRAGATLSFYYWSSCPDTVAYDWATAQITNPSGTVLATPLAKTCVRSTGWARVTYNLAALAGQTVVLKFISHDDNYAGDPTYTRYDDITVG